MDEDEYHQYTSLDHAKKLTDLMVQKRIVEYTMQHNTSETRKLLGQMMGGIPESCIADYDCFIQIVFRDVQDYVNVKNDPHYKQVVMPDHGNFADEKRTKMATGWFERHIKDGQAVSAEGGVKPNDVSATNGVNGANGH